MLILYHFTHNATIDAIFFRNLNVKALIEYCKTGLGSNNPGVRQAARAMLGVMYLYMGAPLHMFFESEPATVRDQLNAEFDKYEGEIPPAPSRGKSNINYFYFVCNFC